MKDFFKWLGVNDKVAKIAIWVLIIMVCLIIINTFLDSLGAPHYMLTTDNLSKINYHKVLVYLASWIMTWLNFFSIVLLVFRIRDFKRIFKYSILYLLLNYLINSLFNYEISQIFIVIYIVIFCFLFSKKNWRYLLYAVGSFALNTVIQYISYIYKIKLIDFNSCNSIQILALSLDYYFLIMLIIISKELYLKKKMKKKEE